MVGFGHWVSQIIPQRSDQIRLGRSNVFSLRYPGFFDSFTLGEFIWRCPKMLAPPNHPKLDHFSIETYDFQDSEV